MFFVSNDGSKKLSLGEVILKGLAKILHNLLKKCIVYKGILQDFCRILHYNPNWLIRAVFAERVTFMSIMLLGPPRNLYFLPVGCLLPKLANLCLSKSTKYNSCQCSISDKDLSEKKKHNKTWPLSLLLCPFTVVSNRKALVREAFIRRSSNICYSIVEFDSSRFYQFLLCQDMPSESTWDGSLTRLCTITRLGITELTGLRIVSCVFSRKQDQNAKLKAFFAWKTRKNWLA